MPFTASYYAAAYFCLLYRNNFESNRFYRTQLLSYEEIMDSPIARSYFSKYLRTINKSQLVKFWEQVSQLLVGAVCFGFKL